MVPMRYPGGAGNGNYVVISNEANGSDGEAFVDHFKSRKLGKVVGVPSWGGLVGILNRQLTIDNGSVEQSNNAFWGRDGKWIVENHGADPDILIDNDPASVMAGKDAQLDKAIETILDMIAKNPFRFPERPAYPKK
jgi:tricorn protease